MTTVTIIVAEFYITRMRQTNLLFREAMGLFWNDRYKAVAESAINLVASLVLVQQLRRDRHYRGHHHQHAVHLYLDRALHLFEIWRSGRMAEESCGLILQQYLKRAAAHGSGVSGSGAVGAAVPGGQLRRFYSGRCCFIQPYSQG